MKKIKYLVVLLLLLILVPLNTYASDGKPKKVYNNIDILDNGDIYVRVLEVLEGTYNGIYRNIKYKNYSYDNFNGNKEDLEGSSIYDGDGYYDLKVYSIDNRNSVDFNSIFSDNKNEFSEVDYANSGDNLVYTREDSTNGFTIKIFAPSNTNTAIYYEYKIKNAVVVHNDIAELAWNYYGDEFEDNIYYFEAKVNLPGEDDDLRVWLHGPLNGLIERKENKYAYVTYDFIGKYNPVSVRVAFNKELVPNATKLSNMDDALNSIIEIETELADEANLERENIKRQNTIYYIFLIITVIVTIIYMIMSIIFRKSQFKDAFNLEYNREFSNDYPPEVVEYLITKQITENSVSAIILSLIDRKIVTTSTTDDTTLLEYDSKNSDKLSESEKDVVKIIFDVIGDGNKVTLKEMKKFGKNLSDAERLAKKYDSWRADAIHTAKAEKFFHSLGTKSLHINLLFIISTLLSIVCLILAVNVDFGSYVILVSAVCILLIIIITTRKYYTKKGADQYNRWKAFKNFLVDFGSFKEKELPEIKLWGKYLVYATVLGVASKLQKDMKLKIKDMNISSSDLASYYLLDSMTDNMYLTNSLANSISSSVHQAVASSRSSIAASQASDGSGFGGGASGGGGSFGGGTGGGHF